ncbi:MAG: YdcF family protein [Chitinophagaceae bacterium]
MVFYFYGQFNQTIVMVIKKKSNRVKWIKRIGRILLLWVLVHVIYITIDGVNDYKGNADVAVVLGNKVLADGSLSSWLRGRVDRALLLYKEGRVKKIYVSGGKGNEETAFYPEGNAMKNYLVAHGVPEADVIADNDGQNTYLTAKDFLAWNKDKHYNSVIVVSQFYHITRTKYIFRKLGFKNVYNASSTRYSILDIISTLREVPAFYKYVLAY